MGSYLILAPKFGDIVVAWLDNRNRGTNSSGNSLMDVYAKYSTDGGQTWSPSFQVNDANNPIDPQSRRMMDYFGAAVYGGTAYVIWDGDTRSSTDPVLGTPTNNALGNPPTPVKEQPWIDSFALSGSIRGEN